MNILIVKLSALGDILHTFPVIEALRHRFPEAKIHWVVEGEAKSLVEAHPEIERVIPVATKRWRRARKGTWKELRRARQYLRERRYELLFDFQGNIKSGLATFQAKAEEKVGFGWGSVAEWPNLLATKTRYNPPPGQNIRQDYLSLVQQHLGDVADVRGQVRLKVSNEDKELIAHLVDNSNLRIAVCPGSAWRSKRLDEKALVDFLDRMHGEWQPYFLWVWGSSDERDLAERLQARFPETSLVVPKLALPTLQHLMWEVDLVVAMDSLALHLAGTTATPSFSIFGPSNPGKYRPIGDHHHIQGSCPFGRSFEKRCPILRSCASAACTQELSGEACYTSFKGWWRSTHRQRLSHPDRTPLLDPE